MNDTKPWYASRTIWAGVVMIMLGIGKLAGLVGDEQAAGLLVTLPDTLMTIINGILAAVAIEGRVSATKTIAPGQ